MIITAKTFDLARKKIKESEKPIVFSSNDDELNRKILEKENIDTLLISLDGRKDFQKQRNSGFNQVLAKIAKKNNVNIGINLDELIHSKEKARIIARIIQNIDLCKKNKIQMIFIGDKESRNKYDLKSLGLILGMPSWMIKND